MLGWNLNPFTPCSRHQPVDLVDRRPAEMRVDAAERDQRVGVVGCRLGDLVVGHRRHAHRRRAVDGEHDRHHLALAVVLRHLARRRAVDVGPGEVAVGGLLELGRDATATGDLRHLGVGVHVDGDERVDVDCGMRMQPAIRLSCRARWAATRRARRQTRVISSLASSRGRARVRRRVASRGRRSPGACRPSCGPCRRRARP